MIKLTLFWYYSSTRHKSSKRPSLLHILTTILHIVFRRLLEIAKSDCQPRHICLSVLPPTRMKHLGSHSTDFNEIIY